MRRRQMVTGLFFVFLCVCILPFLRNGFLKRPDEALKKYKTIILDAPTPCDLPLIPLIEHLRDLSLCATRKITGDDRLAVSFTVYPTSDWKLKKRTVLAFNGLTIYEAFKKVATEFDLSMEYEDGRFVFRDPEYSDMYDKDLFEEDKGTGN
jgi:hypothetical protein